MADLSKAAVRSPPLLKYEDSAKGVDHGTQVDRLRRAAYKCLGEAYMEQTPPAFAKALEVFSQAVPGLPDFSGVLKRKKSKGKTRKGASNLQDTFSRDQLSDETSATLLKVWNTWLVGIRSCAEGSLCELT